MRYILVILFLLAFVSGRADDKVAAPDFSDYPHTESFRAYLSFHTNAARNLQQTNLLTISAFPNGARFALEYLVTESGRANNVREIYNWASQDFQEKQLSETDIQRLRSAIHDLPAKSETPPLERLVIVSFREGTNWMTRTYDSGKLPKAMRQIYDIIGERFESKQTK